MFRNWGFLLGEIWVLLAVAALLGLLVGWLIWGRRAKVKVISAEAAEAARLRQSLSEWRRPPFRPDPLCSRRFRVRL